MKLTLFFKKETLWLHEINANIGDIRKNFNVDNKYSQKKLSLQFFDGRG